MNRYFKFISILLIGTFSAHILIAQEGEQKSEDFEIYELFDISLEDILNVGMVSASQKKQSILDAPANAFIVTETQIRARGYSNLVELLEDIPQIEIQRNSNPESRNVTTIRGIPGNEKFLILLNGIRITPPTGDFYTLSTQFSLVNAVRVEVIIGPASAIYGADAFSGIVNIITKSEEGGFAGAEIKSSAGSYSTVEASFNAGVEKGKFNFLLTGHYYSSAEPLYYEYYPTTYSWYTDNFRDRGLVLESPYWGDIYQVDDFRKWAGDSFTGEPISQEFEMPTESYFINANMGLGDFDVGFIFHSELHSSAHGVRSWYTSYDGNAYIDMDQTVFYARHNYTSFDKRINVQSTLTQSMFEIDPFSNYASALSRWQRGYIYGYSQSSKIKEQFQFQANEKWTITAGASVAMMSALPRTALSPVPFDKSIPAQDQELYYIGAAGFENYADNTGAEFADSLAVEQNFYDFRFRNFGIYSQIQWAPSKKMEMTLGTRYDKNTSFGSTFNPRIGIVYKPAKKLSIKLLYGQAYLAPSPSKTYLQSGAFFSYDNSDQSIYADFFHLPNSGLLPEKLYTLEASINWFINENLSLNVNAFTTGIDDLIDVYSEFTGDPGELDSNIGASRLEISENRGSTLIEGVTARLNHYITFKNTSINTYLGATTIGGWTDFDYDSGDDFDFNWLFYQSDLTFKGGIDISGPKFTLSPRFINRGFSISNIEDINGFNYENEPFTVVNLAASYNLISNKKLGMSVFGKVTNLLDARYYHVYVGSDEGMPRTPQDPRRIQIGLEFDLK